MRAIPGQLGILTDDPDIHVQTTAKLGLLWLQGKARQPSDAAIEEHRSYLAKIAEDARPGARAKELMRSLDQAEYLARPRAEYESWQRAVHELYWRQLVETATVIERVRRSIEAALPSLLAENRAAYERELVVR